MGPLFSGNHRQSVQGFIERAKQSGLGADLSAESVSDYLVTKNVMFTDA